MAKLAYSVCTVLLLAASLASAKETVAPEPKFLRMAQSVTYSYVDANGDKNFSSKIPEGYSVSDVTAIKTEYAVYAAPEPLADGELEIYKCKEENGKYQYKFEEDEKDSKCLHLIVSPPNGKWRLSSISANDITWAHKDLQRVNGRVTVWMLRNNANRDHTDSSIGIMSMKQLTVFDCTKRTYSLIEWIAYAEEDGTGDVVASHSNMPRPEILNIAPDTVGESQFDLICKAKAGNSTVKELTHKQ